MAYNSLGLNPLELGRLSPAAFFRFLAVRQRGWKKEADGPVQGSGDAYQDLRDAGLEIF